MMSPDAIRNIVGIIGNVTSFFLFAGPMPTIWRVLKNKSVEEFKYHPYVAGVMNCVMWIFYAMPFVHPHSLLVTTINSAGLVMYAIYIGIFCFYATNKQRKSVAMWLLGELVAFIGLACITLFAFHTHANRTIFVGILCDIFGIILYGSPLTVMWKVINTKSVEFMPLSLSLACLANGIIWSAYALIKFDIYILIGNGVGAILSVAQLILYACYYGSTPKKAKDTGVKPSQLELSSAV